MEKLIGKGYTKGTLQRYNACKQHVEDYLAFRWKVKDIPVEDVDNQFITGFDHYLKSEKDCAHNTFQKYIVNFKKIIRIAYANQWIGKDSFFHWKGKWKSSEREYFCFYTGLAFADIKKLSEDDIVMDMNGKRWIKTKRQKTKSVSSIPVLDIPQALMDKYADHSRVKSCKEVIPVLSNQKYNSYLKEIAKPVALKRI